MSQQKQTVSLQPGETKTVPFTFTPTAAKVYNVSVDGLSGSFEAIILPADIRVDSITITPSQVNLGDAVAASMRVTNYGGEAGSRDIDVIKYYAEGGSVTYPYTVQLSAGQSKDISLAGDIGLGAEIGSFFISADGVLSNTLEVVGGNASVTGIVKSADTGLPLQGAKVYEPADPSNAVYTDISGRFTFTGINESGVQLEVSYPDYATQRVNVLGLTSNAVKDIGVITLSLISAMRVLSIVMPTGSFKQGNYYVYVRFRVQNISSQTATAILRTASIASGGGGGSSQQFTLAPGGITTWDGVNYYPLAIATNHLGANHIVAYVNDEIVGESDINITV